MKAQSANRKAQITVAGALGFLLASAAGGGCAFSTSPVHAGLTHAQVNTIIAPVFHVGMADTEIEQGLRRLKLGWSEERAEREPGGPRLACMRVTVYPSGPRSTAGFPPVANWGRLNFWLDGGARLSEVTYAKPRGYSDVIPRDVVVLP